MKSIISSVCFIMVLFAVHVADVRAQIDFGSFTYQGFLKDGGVPANGNYEIKVEFYNAAVNGTSLGSTSFSSVAVVNGVFSVDLEGTTGLFQPGAGVWIEISTRPVGSGSAHTILTPRQRVRSAPLAITSLLSYDAQRLGGIDANQYVTTTGGASTFIQNGSTQQTGSFNLDGTGTANVFNAGTQFNINGNRILSANGADNIFAGFLSGQNNSSGSSNSFFGVLSGGANTTGNFNSFFGRGTGVNNSGGNANSFFGSGAGNANSTGGNNSFFGSDAGSLNVGGNNNTIIGAGANVTSNNLTNATALGFRAAVSQSNSLILGSINGINGASADTNVGIGLTNPTQRLQVVGNGVFSGNLGVGTTTPGFKFELMDSSNTGLRVQNNSAGGTVASFGGLGAFRVDASGVIGGRLSILENGNIGLGTNNPLFNLHVVGQNIRVEGNNSGVFPRFSLNFTGGGTDAKKWQNYATTNSLRFSALNDPESAENIWLNVIRAGNVVTDVQFPSGNVAISKTLTVNGGLNYFDTVGNANFFMKSAGAANGINFGVAANAGSNSTLYISQYDGTTYQDRIILDNTGNINIPTRLFVGSNTTDALVVNGSAVTRIGTDAPYTGTVCYKSLGNLLSRIVECTLSSIRYKTNVNDLSGGLDVIKRLRPVSFNWKTDNSPDFGFIAEEVSEAEPRLAVYEQNGEVKGVKYEKVSIFLVKAAQEQQTQIESQQKQIDEQNELIKQQQEKLEKQQAEIDALKQLVCASNKTAKVCEFRKP